jgi:hypothetical protein
MDNKEKSLLYQVARIHRKWMSRRQAADYLGISIDVFDRLDIPYVELGKRLHKFDVDDLNVFMYSRKVTACAPNLKEQAR